ncbi:unnamed protein product, partial [marine sediment metagenome]
KNLNSLCSLCPLWLICLYYVTQRDILSGQSD